MDELQAQEFCVNMDNRCDRVAPNFERITRHYQERAFPVHQTQLGQAASETVYVRVLIQTCGLCCQNWTQKAKVILPAKIFCAAHIFFPC